MMGVLKRLLGDGQNQGRFTAGGKEVVCPHCGYKEFEEGEAQLNTAGLSFMNLDWLNKSAVILICTHCSRIQWFGKPPEKG